MSKTTYVPITPGGTVIFHLESETEEEAWSKLLEDASHMPYKSKQEFIERGYEISTLTDEV